MNNRDADGMLLSLFDSMAFDSPKRCILDELKEHEPIPSSISDVQATHGTHSLEMFWNIRKRSTELPIQDDWHRALWPSSPPNQLGALRRHLGRIQPCVHHSDPSFL